MEHKGNHPKPVKLSGIANWLREDLRGFWNAVIPGPVFSRRLHSYRIESPEGKRRIHLRKERDGSALLFIDVSQVMHLNPTAAQLFYMALEKVPRRVAPAKFMRRFRNVPRKEIEPEIRQIYDLVEHLLEPGNLCPVSPLSSIERNDPFSHPAGAPFKVDLAITYKCNNRCVHCYNEESRRLMPSLSRVEWLRVLDRVHAIGIPHLIFTGGEATLHPDLPELISYSEDKGAITGLNTNGRKLADPSFVNALVSSGLDHVQITLASCRKEIHNGVTQAESFLETVAGIRNAVSSPLHLVTNTTLTRRNADHIEETIEFIHSLGVRTFALNGMIHSGCGFHSPDAIPAEEMAPILDSIRELAAEKGMRFLWYTPTEYCRLSPVDLELGPKRCNAAEYSICIEPNGDVLPCQSYYESAGNILGNPWEEIWNSDLFLGFRSRREDPVGAGLPEKCAGCPDLPLCGGGCPLERKAVTAALMKG